MKRKLSKFLALVLAFTLTWNVLTPVASAHEIERPEQEEAIAASPGGVLVFVAGILVGYVIDGVLVYATGHSAAELTAIAIQRIIDLASGKSAGSSIHVDENGIEHGGAGGKFSIIGALY